MEVIEVAGKLLGLAVADVGDSASEDDETRWARVGSGASYEGGDSDDETAVGKRKRMSAEDRKARNRERNRLHARKTRQRKKQHVQELQLKIWGLRQERQRLLQLSTEHHTAGVLLALSCSPQRCVQRLQANEANAPRSPPSPTLPASSGRDWNRELASHEENLRKITREFESMDAGQQMADDGCAGMGESSNNPTSGASSGKGARGAKGTLADRTALRRERNRMHAKRTRNRKKLFVEACSIMIDKMKVENAQLKDEIRAAGVRIPEHPWVATAQETIPEEPLPEYLAALWEFAEGKSQSKKLRGSQAVAWQAPSSSSKTQESSTSFTSTKPSSTDQSPSKTEPSAPGEALEDAEKLCAFMEAAQTRSAKRPRVGNEGVLPRVWSDHGSTTSESRGSLESDDEAAGEREAAGRATGGTEGSASPSMWTSRQVLERYALPREVC